MAVENIEITDNIILDTEVGIGYWRDPENSHWTNQYRNLKITGNLILNAKVASVQLKAIEEKNPAGNKNILAGNTIFAAQVPPMEDERPTPVRIFNPGLWSVRDNTFPNGLQGLKTGDFREFKSNRVFDAPLRGFELKDFRPAPALVVPETKITRAKYPVIDVHTHINDAMMSGGNWTPVEKLIEGMDRLNIRKIVILTGKWGDELQKVIDFTVKPHPDRFTVFTQLDWSRVDEPDFAPNMVTQIEDAVKRGARGLEILKDFGLTVKYKNGQLVKIDEPRFDPIWKACGRLKIPVFIHTADPAAFFDPINEKNERYEELALRPEWSFASSRFPKKAELLKADEAVFTKFPGTRFVALHMANSAENLDYVAGLLHKLPNVSVEFGAREAELGRQPRHARKLFEEFPDRIMFGTDWGFSDAQYQNYFRFLETEDENFAYWDWPLNGPWRISGLGLPDKILKKVYFENAEKLLER
jgi:predicted TIM-barrel fold metal-dependent hydrolase